MEFSCQLTGLKAAAPRCDELQSWELRVASLKDWAGADSCCQSSGLCQHCSSTQTPSDTQSLSKPCISHLPKIVIYQCSANGLLVQQWTEIFLRAGRDVNNTNRHRLGWCSGAAARSQAEEPQLGQLSGCDLLAQKPGRHSHAWAQSSSHIPGASRGCQPTATCLPTPLCFLLPAAQPGGFSLFIEVKKRI